MQLHRPQTVDAALHLLAERPCKLLAGGTDFFPSLAGQPWSVPVLDLSQIAALRGICRSGGAWRIGATTTWSQIRYAELPDQFKALQLAAAEVGSVQIQNSGTIAGNLCNASPAADGVPPLLSLRAQVEITDPRGVRHLPIADFITGVRKTALLPGELVTALIVPDQPDSRSYFLKLGARRYLVISIAMVAVNIVLSPDHRLDDVSIAVGACSPIALRLSELEEMLRGIKPGSEAFDQAFSKADLSALLPIDDVRASAAYRLEAVRTLVKRAILQAVQGRE